MQMTDSNSHPNSDPIYGLYDGSFLGQFTRLALLLDVFTPLTSGPATAEKVAASCNASAAGIRPLLDYLSSMKVLEYQNQKGTYALTRTAGAFLVRDEKTYAGDWVLANTDPILWDKMLETLRTGKSTGYTLPWAQDAWLESYSPSRVKYSIELWHTVGIELSHGQPFRMLDLACGCGIKTLAFAQANKPVQVTCIDSESVLEVARDLAMRFKIAEQVTFNPGDILSDEFGTERFHAALLGLITYFLTPKQNINVFHRAFRALKPGGRLVIDAIMSTDRPDEWASRATMLMNTWNGGAAHSFSEYQAWLKEVGFSKVVQHNNQLLSAVK
jgi:ubiquinone/menaquinone biosynthesis C-methylase UbiE